METLERWVQRAWFFWFGRTVFLIYVRLFRGLRVEGDHHVPRSGGAVIASNHGSSWDPPVMGVAVPREVNYLAKKELFEKPLPRLVYLGLRALPIDRSKSDLGAIKEALRRLKSGTAIGIFAQGTRNAGDAEALDGAAFLAQRSGAPLVPAAVWAEGRAFRVRFGEPFVVEGRGRAAVQAATAELMRRVNALLPGARESFDVEAYEHEADALDPDAPGPDSAPAPSPPAAGNAGGDGDPKEPSRS